MNMQVTDWAEHYKAVRNRIAGAKKPAPKPRATGRILYSAPIGPVFVRDWLHVSVSKTRFAEIRDEILAREGYTLAEFEGVSRLHKLSAARAEIWYCAHRDGYSLSQIGRLSGGRDHSTIFYGIAKIRGKLEGVEYPRIVKNRLSSRERYLASRSAAIAAE